MRAGPRTQIGPKRMAKMHGGKPRVATIHEYLDWTVTAQTSTEDDELVSSDCTQPGLTHVGMSVSMRSQHFQLLNLARAHTQL